ncbi:MAG: cyclic nucleotide-binding domain-containing protein, partial [Planctomycetaceae bacterium]|nr:cyclic nucleotide-binding domain-containing protein [Planctomycetaceae bacterium]
LPFNVPLHDSPLLKDLSEEELRTLFEHMEHLCYESDSLIIEQGTENKGLWLLSDGCCEVIRNNTHGSKCQVLAMLGPGTVFGEMSFFQQTSHSANIKAVTKATVHKLSPEAFEDLSQNTCNTATKLLTNIVRVMADRLQLMDKWVCELMGNTTEKVEEATKQDEWHEFRAKLYSEWDFS